MAPLVHASRIFDSLRRVARDVRLQVSEDRLWGLAVLVGLLGDEDYSEALGVFTQGAIHAAADSYKELPGMAEVIQGGRAAGAGKDADAQKLMRQGIDRLGVGKVKQVVEAPGFNRLLEALRGSMDRPTLPPLPPPEEPKPAAPPAAAPPAAAPPPAAAAPPPKTAAPAPPKPPPAAPPKPPAPAPAAAASPPAPAPPAASAPANDSPTKDPADPVAPPPAAAAAGPPPQDRAGPSSGAIAVPKGATVALLVAVGRDYITRRKAGEGGGDAARWDPLLERLEELERLEDTPENQALAADFLASMGAGDPGLLRREVLKAEIRALRARGPAAVRAAAEAEVSRLRDTYGRATDWLGTPILGLEGKGQVYYRSTYAAEVERYTSELAAAASLTGDEYLSRNTAIWMQARALHQALQGDLEGESAWQKYVARGTATVARAAVAVPGQIVTVVQRLPDDTRRLADTLDKTADTVVKVVAVSAGVLVLVVLVAAVARARSGD